MAKEKTYTLVLSVTRVIVNRLKYLTCLFFALFVSVLLYAYPGIYYEELTDVFFTSLHNGLLTGIPEAIFNNYGCLLGIGHLLKLLYIKYPAIPWYGVLLFLSNVFAFANYLYYLFNLENNTNKLVFIVLFSVLFIPDILFVQFTKIAIHLVFSSLLLLASVKVIPAIIKAVCYILLVLAFMMRFESFLFAALVFVVFYTFQNHYFASFKKIWTVAVFVCSLIIIYPFISEPKTLPEKNYAEIKPYKYALWDYGDKLPAKYNSMEDSLKITMFSKVFIPCAGFANKELFDKYNIRKYDKNIIKIVKDGNFNIRNIKIFFVTLFLLGKYIVLSYVLSLVFLVFRFKNNWRLLLFNICILLLLLIICVLFKLELRVSVPVFFIGILLNILQLVSQSEKNIYKLNIAIIIIAFLLNTAEKGIWAIHRHNAIKSINAIEKYCADKGISVLLYNFFSNALLYDKILNSVNFKATTTKTCIDCAYASFYGNVLTGLESGECFGNLNVLAATNTVLVSDTGRVNIYNTYFKYFKNNRYTVEAIAGSPVFTDRWTSGEQYFKLYYIRVK